jgi:uncharacterized protein
MNNKVIIKRASSFIRKSLENAEAGHDWLHTKRVLSNARKILKKEKADKTGVLLGLLFHDLADPKFNHGDTEKGIKLTKAFMEETNVREKTAKKVIDIVQNISYGGSLNKKKKASIELKIARDADRLDALGAIGLARAFHYGGYTGRKIYDPNIKPVKYLSEKVYRENSAPTINHFYEKLLLLKRGMYTKTAKKIAIKRHKYLMDYLKRFKRELKGKA